MNASSDFILASGSAVRAKLLSNAGVPFRAIPAEIDEDALKNAYLKNASNPSELESLALYLAQEKAKDVSSRHPEALILGADQILLFEGQVFNKPRDADDLRQNLKILRGKTHQLINGTTLFRDRDEIWSQTKTCRLTMRDFSDAFIDSYIEAMGDSVLACVGGYQFEAMSVQLFDHVDGDYFTILGLPVLDLMDPLRNAGVLAT